MLFGWRRAAKPRAAKLEKRRARRVSNPRGSFLWLSLYGAEVFVLWGKGYRSPHWRGSSNDATNLIFVLCSRTNTATHCTNKTRKGQRRVMLKTPSVVTRECHLSCVTHIGPNAPNQESSLRTCRALMCASSFSTKCSRTRYTHTTLNPHPWKASIIILSATERFLLCRSRSGTTAAIIKLLA